ncbi:VIR protein [Plasmodium vivax]|uniref:VIR protein n=1 Tax=Plasmodium vivax TaxID=5855 RepID=A0A1G4EF30_PLAVI|nr:VIR protein [Plasmodium vivax]
MINLEEEISKIPEIKFYNILLDVVAGTENVNEYLEKYTDCPCSNLEKKYITKFIKNYNIYKNYLTENSYEKYCSYFKHWLHREKLHIPRGNNNNVLNNWKQCVPCLLDKLEQENNKPNTKCNFKYEDFSYAFVQIKIILDNMCIIKEQNDLMEKIESNRELCISFNKKIDEYIKSLFRQLSSIPNNSSWKKEYFNIEKNCSDGKIHDLFAKIECPSDESNDVQKQETCLTPEAIIQQDCTEQTCKNLDQLCEQRCAKHSCSNSEKLCEKTCEEKPCNPEECAIKNNCTPQSCDSLEQLYPTLCKIKLPNLAHTSEEPANIPYKNPHLQLPVTVFSSVVGTIFFFLFLYKVKDISF